MPRQIAEPSFNTTKLTCSVCGATKGYQAFGALSEAANGQRKCRSCRLREERDALEAADTSPRPLPDDLREVIRAKLRPVIRAVIEEEFADMVARAVREALRVEQAQPHHLFARAEAVRKSG